MANSLNQELLHFLQNITYLKHIPIKNLNELAGYFELLHVKSGKVLIHENDVGDSLYIIHSGCFVVYKYSKQNQKLHLREVKRSEMIGELSIITEERRAANVVAIRDSMVWCLSKKNFDHFFQKYPNYLLNIMKPIILRFLNRNQEHKLHSSTISLIPLGPNLFNQEFINQFVKGINNISLVLHINYEKFKSIYGQELNESFDNLNQNLKFFSWLSSQENNFRYIIFEGDYKNSAWNEFCIRQSNSVLFIINSKESSYIDSLKRELSLEMMEFKKIKIIQTHAHDVKIVSKTIRLNNDQAIDVYHIREHNLVDIQRLVRIETGNGIALVLGGGGARGMAHIGVYQALLELKIPIDIVGGTSIGSMIAGSIGLEQSPELIVDNWLKYVIRNKKLYDYTLPYKSFLKGKAVLSAVMGLFPKEINIEDLWKNYFCIASNFTTREMEIIKSGPLYRAVRASASLPGIVPPISNARRELLLDGGIFNNLPIDIMKNIASPCQIIGIRVSPLDNFYADISDGVFSVFDNFFSRNKFANIHNRNLIPNIADIIVGSISLHNDKKEQIQLAQANFSLDLNLSHIALLEFERYSEIIEYGYQQAIEKFSNNDSLMALSLK